MIAIMVNVLFVANILCNPFFVFINVTVTVTVTLNEIYAIAHNHAQECNNKSMAIKRDPFFDMLFYIHKKILRK